MKIRTRDELFDRLDKEMAWRTKEISDYVLLVRSATGSSERSLIRGGVALAYAHLEGFVKIAGELYLSFIESRRLKFNQLIECFFALAVKKHIGQIYGSNSYESNSKTVAEILIIGEKRATFNLQKSIDTESNLKYNVFQNIIFSVGFDEVRYQEFRDFMDEELLSRRNKIAHGEFLLITDSEFQRIVGRVVEVMRLFKNDIENASITEAYRQA